ncbi:sulfite exporter TauE/SafE family protein [Furfurilactobacillus entadae]|uniref:sulfite exporter TauE/SafE family protein n=1 Tax=Furfurilactobacillus entadae TaxID=2922307 RepID=UPI0035E7B55E
MIFIIFLFIAGIIAGIISTVTGMASLVSYPMLLAAGLSPVVANVTNTTGLVFAGFSSGISSRQELKYNYRDLFWISPLIVIGGVIGSVLLLVFPNDVFEKIVPFMIFAVAIVFAVQPRLRLDDAVALDGYVPVKKTLTTVVLVFLIGVYGGYFGAAAGVFTLLVFSETPGLRLTVANAIKNVAGGMANLVATIIFIFSGKVQWSAAIPMGVGFFVGGYIGPKIARYMPAKLLRWLIIIGALILAGNMFYGAFIR